MPICIVLNIYNVTIRANQHLKINPTGQLPVPAAGYPRSNEGNLLSFLGKTVAIQWSSI